MNKIRRTTTTAAYDYQPLDFNKSPLKRNNPYPTARSPLRSRTPTRPLSPLNVHPANPIRFIPNVSPLKDREEREKFPEVENQGEFANGRSIKYINHPTNDKFY
jgi:hypothetical protein